MIQSAKFTTNTTSIHANLSCAPHQTRLANASNRKAAAG